MSDTEPDTEIVPTRDHRQLQQLIARLSEGIILIDFDQTILWANEAALNLHGVTHQDDLGADVDAYRSRFRLTFRNNHPVKAGEHPIERVLTGEKPRDVVVDVSPVARPDATWVHAIRCVVITDPQGAPDYLVLVIEDQTERYEAEDRFESAFNANPAPALICRMSDLCFVRVNQGFLEMTGCAKEDVVGHSIYELDILGNVEDRGDAVKGLRRGETMTQREAMLSLPDGSSKGVIVAGQPIEVKDEACALFTFVDLEPRLRAEAALRHSEERFSKAFKSSPVASSVCAAHNFQFIEVNKTFLRLTGYTEEELVGRSPMDLALWQDSTAQKRFLTEIEGSDALAEQELQLRLRDGSILDCVIAGDVITVDDTRCVLVALRDITENKRSETELIAAIDAVLADTTWLSRGIIERLAGLRQSAKPSAAAAEFAALTDRERDVLGLICEGATDAAMAERLRLSRHTIRNHLSTLYRKIGVTHRGAAAVWARERGTTDLASARAHRQPKKG
jgi:PAS domain S-box-containing protein